jgi:type IX secretion system PorP/SprF family membrane protein
MKHCYKILIFFISLFGVKNGYAQTPFMSQPFVATNFFNPANVGFGTNNQFQTFYRNQFSGVGDPFKTIGVGVDFALFKNEENEGYNNFGLGLQGVSEQVLNGVLQTNEITLSLANRVFLNKDRTSFFSIGISSTYISRNIDRNALTFGDQYNSGRLFNTTSLETIGDFPTKFSTNGGIMYSFVSPDVFLQTGASTFYINRSANALNYGNVNQSFQMITTLNYEHRIMEDNTFFIHADYQNRLEAEFVYVGGAVGLPMNVMDERQNKFYVGCFYRSKDAIVPYVGMLYNKYKIGLTYDIYQNSMTMSNLHPQTIEFNLSTYLGRNISKNLKSIFN